MEQRKSEAWIFALTVASAASALVSIFLAETLGVLACLLWLVFRPVPARLPTYFVPLSVFMATTLFSLAMSAQPGIGRAQINKFVLFAMGLLAANFITTARRAKTSYAVLLAVAAAGSAVGIVQFAMSYSRFSATGELADDPTVLARITGFMSHWMTFSGEQLLVWCAAVPALMVLGRNWLIPLSLVGIGIILSFTRSVWLGTAAGLSAIAVTVPRRLLLAVIMPMAAVGLISSGLIYHRIALSTEPDFAPDTGRLALLSAGAQMIHDHPFFGVGPERIPIEFPRYYTGNDLHSFYYGHMHNNFMQIAAERGLLCFAAFLWFIFELYASLLRCLRAREEMPRLAALSALAALTGFLVAGLFENNFGDSEVLLLLLFLVSIPFGIQEMGKGGHVR
jgi:putative inorganic carbon (hco3(-)) transporter